MEINKLNDLSNTIKKFSVSRFASQTASFVNASSFIDEMLIHRISISEISLKNYRDSHEKLVRESEAILSQSAISQNHFINFPFRLNGNSDEMTRISFHKMKSHQMELLATISDNVYITRSFVNDSAKIRNIIIRNFSTIRKTSRFMEILRERIARRPTAMIRLDSKQDKKIHDLNKAFNTINSYEDGYCLLMGDDSQIYPGAFDMYRGLLSHSASDILNRIQRITSDVKELKQGFKLFRAIAFKGYSKSMRKQLDMFIDYHQRRTHEFRNHVMTSRIETIQ